MKPSRCATLTLTLTLGACARVPARAQDPDLAHDAHASAAAMREMGGAQGAESLHMRMTDARPAAPGDSARAAAVVVQMRSALGRYRDVRAAQADGFRQFLPGVTLPVYHFTRRANALGEAFRFDPAHPTSLLYRRDAAGRFQLVGAMYTAPRRFSQDRLDARIPLSIAHWHQHVDWCIPPRGQAARWRETQGGAPRFGPQSPIHTRPACDSAGGVFVPHLFGWMVHANAFAGDDPHEIWSDHHGGQGMEAHGMQGTHDMHGDSMR